MPASEKNREVHGHDVLVKKHQPFLNHEARDADARKRVAALAGAAAVGTMIWLERFADVPGEPVAEAGLPAAPAPLLAEATEILAVRAPAEDARDTTPLAELLADPAVPKDTATAFATLFTLWGRSYEPGSQPACQQAEVLNLRCWFQRGSVTYLRSLDRPAILNLIGEEGEQYQVVLQHMDADTASLAFGSRTVRTSLTDLSRYWFGDSLMLWRPGALQGEDLAPGMEGEGVRWLRASLERIGGDSDSGGAADAGSPFFDSDLEARVRDYQRQRRLSVDGIAGAQTQIAINTDLDIPGTPSLTRAN